MTSIGRLSCALSCATWLWLAPIEPAVADPSVDPATRTAIQEVITKQLQAFAKDDAAGAEAFASKGIQQKFPEPAKFLAMVKTGYAALIRPKSTQFGETTASPHGPIQKMMVVAADGTVWTATYVMEAADGGWRIVGCGLEKVEGQQDI